jgi:hypothetical protein
MCTSPFVPIPSHPSPPPFFLLLALCQRVPLAPCVRVCSMVGMHTLLSCCARAAVAFFCESSWLSTVYVYALLRWTLSCRRVLWRPLCDPWLPTHSTPPTPVSNTTRMASRSTLPSSIAWSLAGLCVDDPTSHLPFPLFASRPGCPQDSSSLYYDRGCRLFRTNASQEPDCDPSAVRGNRV